MKMRWIALILAGLNFDAQAWPLAFRCDGQPVEIGWHLREDVLAICGEPQATENRVIFRGDRSTLARSSELRQIDVEYWQYNFVHRYILRFENNVLKAIEDLDA